MRKEKSEMTVMAGALAFLGGITTAIIYSELSRQIPTFDWGICFGVVLGLISAGLAFAVSRHPGASGTALTLIGFLLLVMSLISVGNSEPLIHGWRGAFEYVVPARPGGLHGPSWQQASVRWQDIGNSIRPANGPTIPMIRCRGGSWPFLSHVNDLSSRSSAVEEVLG